MPLDTSILERIQKLAELLQEIRATLTNPFEDGFLDSIRARLLREGQQSPLGVIALHNGNAHGSVVSNKVGEDTTLNFVIDDTVISELTTDPVTGEINGHFLGYRLTSIDPRVEVGNGIANIYYENGITLVKDARLVYDSGFQQYVIVISSSTAFSPGVILVSFQVTATSETLDATSGNVVVLTPVCIPGDTGPCGCPPTMSSLNARTFKPQIDTLKQVLKEKLVTKQGVAPKFLKRQVPQLPKQVVSPKVAKQVVSPKVAKQVVSPTVAKQVVSPKVAKQVVSPKVAKQSQAVLAAHTLRQQALLKQRQVRKSAQSKSAATTAALAQRSKPCCGQGAQRQQTTQRLRRTAKSMQ